MEHESGNNPYRHILDKLKSHSNRIFSKTYARNRTFEPQLSAVVRELEKERDLNIRNSHEQIWKISSQDCLKPKLPKTKIQQPYYLGRQRSVSLPTPAELSSLLPRAVARKKRASMTQYRQVSNRRLSTVPVDNVHIFHYRQILGDRRKTDIEKPLCSSHIDKHTYSDLKSGQNINNIILPENRKLRRQSISEVFTGINSVKEVTMLARQLRISRGNSEQANKHKITNPPLSVTFHPNIGEPTKNKTHTNKELSKSPKVSQSSYLEMYRRQLAEHKRSQTETSNISSADKLSKYIRERRSHASSAPTTRVQTPEIPTVRPKTTDSVSKASPEEISLKRPHSNQRLLREHRPRSRSSSPTQMFYKRTEPNFMRSTTSSSGRNGNQRDTLKLRDIIETKDDVT